MSFASVDPSKGSFFVGANKNSNQQQSTTINSFGASGTNAGSFGGGGSRGGLGGRGRGRGGSVRGGRRGGGRSGARGGGRSGRASFGQAGQAAKTSFSTPANASANGFGNVTPKLGQAGSGFGSVPALAPTGFGREGAASGAVSGRVGFGQRGVNSQRRGPGRGRAHGRGASEAGGRGSKDSNSSGATWFSRGVVEDNVYRPRAQDATQVINNGNRWEHDKHEAVGSEPKAQWGHGRGGSNKGQWGHGRGGSNMGRVTGSTMGRSTRGRGRGQGRGSTGGLSDADKRTVYVSNVEYSTTQNDLAEHFAACGEIVRTTIKRGFAYVEFSAQPSVELALELSGSTLNSRPIKVARYNTPADAGTSAMQKQKQTLSNVITSEHNPPNQQSSFNSQNAEPNDASFGVPNGSVRRTGDVHTRLTGGKPSVIDRISRSGSSFGNENYFGVSNSEAYITGATSHDEASGAYEENNAYYEHGEGESEHYDAGLVGGDAVQFQADESGEVDFLDVQQRRLAEERKSTMEKIAKLEQKRKMKKAASVSSSPLVSRGDPRGRDHAANIKSRLGSRTGEDLALHTSFHPAPLKIVEVDTMTRIGVESQVPAHGLDNHSDNTAPAYTQALPGAIGVHGSYQKTSVVATTDVAEDESRMARLKAAEDAERSVQDKAYSSRDVSTAQYIVGTCHDMCPEPERYRRKLNGIAASEGQVFWIECTGMHYTSKILDHSLCVKEYRKEAADNAMALASQLRPLDVLRRTMQFLCSDVVGLWGSDTLKPIRAKVEWHKFLEDRFRAIRKDISIQNISNVGAVRIFEQIIRFHIAASHQLHGLEDFEPAQNDEKLSKSLKTLRDMYRDLRGSSSDDSGAHLNEAELRAYDILINITRPVESALQGLPRTVTAHPVMRRAIEMYTAYNQNNYVRFFKLARSGTFLSACTVHRHFRKIRVTALRILRQAHSVLDRPGRIPIRDIVRILAFCDDDEAVMFLQECNVVVDGNEAIFSGSIESPTTPELQCKWIHGLLSADCNCQTLSEIIWGGKVPSWPRIVPTDSFSKTPRAPSPHVDTEEPKKAVAPDVGFKSNPQATNLNASAAAFKSTKGLLKESKSTIVSSTAQMSTKRENSVVVPRHATSKSSPFAASSANDDVFKSSFGGNKTAEAMGKAPNVTQSTHNSVLFGAASVSVGTKGTTVTKGAASSTAVVNRATAVAPRNKEEDLQKIQRQKAQDQEKMRQALLKKEADEEAERKAKAEALRKRKQELKASAIVHIGNQIVVDVTEVIVNSLASAAVELHNRKLHLEAVARQLRLKISFDHWYRVCQHRQTLRDFPMIPAISQDGYLKLRSGRCNRSGPQDVYDDQLNLGRMLKRCKLAQEDPLKTMDTQTVICNALKLIFEGSCKNDFAGSQPWRICAGVFGPQSMTTTFTTCLKRVLFQNGDTLEYASIEACVPVAHVDGGDSLHGTTSSSASSLSLELTWIPLPQCGSKSNGAGERFPASDAALVAINYPGPQHDGLGFWAAVATDIDALQKSMRMPCRSPLIVLHDWPLSQSAPNLQIERIVHRYKSVSNEPQFILTVLALPADSFTTADGMNATHELMHQAIKWSIGGIAAGYRRSSIPLGQIVDFILQSHVLPTLEKLTPQVSGKKEKDSARVLVQCLNSALETLFKAIKGYSIDTSSIASSMILPTRPEELENKEYDDCPAFFVEIARSVGSSALQKVVGLISIAEIRGEDPPWLDILSHVIYAQLSELDMNSIRVSGLAEEIVSEILNELIPWMEHVEALASDITNRKLSLPNLANSPEPEPRHTGYDEQEHPEESRAYASNLLDRSFLLVEGAERNIKSEQGLSMSFSDQLSKWLAAGSL